MSQQVAYTIVILHPELPPQTLPLTASPPIELGTRDGLAIRLVGDDIPEAAGRIVLSEQGRRVILMCTNKEASLRLGTTPVHMTTPVEWLPGTTLFVGQYQLRLERRDGWEDHSRDGFAVETLDAVGGASLVDQTIDPRYSTAPAQPVHHPAPPPPASARDDDRTPARPARVPEESQFVRSLSMQSTNASTDTSPASGTTSTADLSYPGHADAAPQPTLGYVFPQMDAPPPSPPLPLTDYGLPRLAADDVDLQMTRLKDWHVEQKLSAQVGLGIINVVPGERITIPLYIANNSTHAVALLLMVHGLPPDWEIASTQPVEAQRGTVRAYDLIIQTRPVALLGPMTLNVALVDRASPEIRIDVTLRLMLKQHPDLVASVQPMRGGMRPRRFLTLQNMTLAALPVALSIGHSDPEVRVTLPQHTVSLTPNQRIEVPLTVEILKHPLLQRADYEFHLTVQQGSRAPLDVIGRVVVLPRILAVGRWVVLGAIALIALIVLIFLLSLRGDVGLGAVFSDPTPTATPTATLPPTPTLTATPTPTQPPSETPLPTETGVSGQVIITDPRPPGCTAAIPSGWVLHRVEAGDNLYRLGLQARVSPDTIAEVNCLANINAIEIGQVILIPPG